MNKMWYFHTTAHNSATKGEGGTDAHNMDEFHRRYAEQQKPARCVASSTPTSGGTGLMGVPMGTQGASYTEHSGQMGDGHTRYLDWAGGNRAISFLNTH